MPDFEKLIQHQQSQQPATNQRLKVVDSSDFEIDKNKQKVIQKDRIITNIFGGFIGSIIGTLTILFLHINNYLPMDLMKLK